MDKSPLALYGFAPLVIGVTIFLLLWVIIFKTIESIPLFKSKAVAAVTATCVSLLSVIGMFQLVAGEDATHRVTENSSGGSAIFNMILLPYVVLGTAIVVLALYLLTARPRGNHDNAEHRFESDLGGGDRLAEDNSEEAFQEMEAGHDNSRGRKAADRPPRKCVDQNDARKATKSNRIKR